MNSNDSLADAAWNTHRCYSDVGQRIAAAILEDGRVAFADVDRRIEGITTASAFGAGQIHVRPTADELVAFVMKAYHCQRCEWGLRCPKHRQQLVARLCQAALAVESRSELI